MSWAGASLVATTIVTLLAQTLRMAVPYVCAGLGGVWSERSGVVNIALEGILLSGALAGVVAHVATASPWAGVVAGALLGAAIGGAHALLVVRGRVDAIVSGLAVNLVASGGTRFALRALYDSSSNSPSVAGFRSALLAGPGSGLLLARTLADPIALVTVAALVWTAWVQARTRFGLRLRACGEDPVASRVAGVDVGGVRLAAVSIGGAMAGLGGVALAYDQHQFQSGMSAGRGFIALAAVILSGWRPVGTAVACVAFAALDALQILLQDRGRSAGSLVQMLPYVATLVALAVIAKATARTNSTTTGLIRARAPAGLGKSPD